MKKMLVSLFVFTLVFGCQEKVAPVIDGIKVKVKVMDKSPLGAVYTFSKTNPASTVELKNNETFLLKTNQMIGTTGNDNYVIIPEIGIIKLIAGSSIGINQIMNKTKLNLAGGKIIAVIDKLKKEQGFEVNTPTAVVGVRGTIFSVALLNDNETEIRLLKGSVEAGPIGKEGVVITSNNIALISENEITVRPISFNELLRDFKIDMSVKIMKTDEDLSSLTNFLMIKEKKEKIKIMKKPTDLNKNKYLEDDGRKW